MIGFTTLSYYLLFIYIIATTITTKDHCQHCQHCHHHHSTIIASIGIIMLSLIRIAICFLDGS
jgi:hypothetical protein